MYLLTFFLSFLHHDSMITAEACIASLPGSPRAQKENLSCTASDRMLEEAWNRGLLGTFCQHVMLIDSHLPTLYYMLLYLFRAI